MRAVGYGMPLSTVTDTTGLMSGNVRQSVRQWITTTEQPLPRAAFRRLRGYAFDPSLSVMLDTALGGRGGLSHSLGGRRA
jgi:hypothetical protein